MDVVEAGCLIQEGSGEGYVLKPRTRLDRELLAAFVGGRGRYINVRLMNRAQSKTYDQTKAFWALLGLYYRAIFREHPTSRQLRWLYDELLPDLFPVRESVLKDGEFRPKHWSELTKEEGAEVISKVVTLVSEQYNVPEDVQASVRDIFEWIQQEKNVLKRDPTDFHRDGTPLSKDEWAEANRICMCTGVVGGDVCHIVSRELGKGYGWLIEQPWNFYRARHDIHIDIQHRLGWDALFDGVPRLNYFGAPWLRPRYERAMRLFDEGKRMSNGGRGVGDVLYALALDGKDRDGSPVLRRWADSYESRLGVSAPRRDSEWDVSGLAALAAER